jgi:hypothetical protein
MIFRRSLLSFLVLAVAGFARATTVQPPEFPELVAEADAIYRGHVTAVHSERFTAPDGSNLIKTLVTFAVERPLKGGNNREIVLEFLGGTVGNDTLAVDGMPAFAVGDREILFVQRNGTQICPLVRMMHGRYRIERDPATARDYIARDDRFPLTTIANVAQPMAASPGATSRAAAAAQALSPADFEAQIVAEVQRTSGAGSTR